MRPCPHCGLAVAEEDAVCPYCGHDMPPVHAPPPMDAPPPVDAPTAPRAESRARPSVVAQPFRAAAEPAPPGPAPVATDAAPVPTAPAPTAPAPTAPAPTAPAAGEGTSNRLLVVTAVAGLVVGAIVLLLLFRLSAGRESPPGATKSAAAASAGGAARRPSVSLAPSAPKWKGAAASAGRTRDGARIVEYELPAENEVPVWMTRVRPTLVVRCVSRETDVLVLMHSAASFEPEAGKHTVRIGLDAGADATERWLESDDAQALFAPDGVALARRIAGSRMMRFGFTPHNAPPAVVDFDVRGFDALIGSLAKACGWKP